MRRLGLLCAVVVALILAPTASATDEPESKGLFVAPARDYISVTSPGQQQKQLTVANYTGKPAVISLSVQKFSVADYSYDFTFTPTDDDWIYVDQPHIELEPGKSQNITYTLQVPAGAKPGGHYFTILVSTTIQTGAVQSKLQAAALVYVTVQGKVYKTSQIVGQSVPAVSFGGDIPFTLNIKNTGNTHFFVYVAGQMQGAAAGAPSTHLLMPQTTRTMGGSMPAPLLPGIYTADFGYKTDGGETVERTTTVVYLPVWSLVLIVGGVWLVIVIVRRLLRRRRSRGLRLPPYTS